MTPPARARTKTPWLGLACLAAMPVPALADTEADWLSSDWSIGVFAGRLTTDETSNIVRGDVSFEDAGSLSVAANKTLFAVTDDLTVEGEAMVSRHFGDQTHWELNGALLARWETFPWDDAVDTSLAIGNGLSIASETPELEKRRRPDASAATLNSVIAEVTFGAPGSDGWDLVLRYQHRSGAFGTYGGVTEAATTFAIGLRHSF